jgi:hypothetical protein
MRIPKDTSFGRQAWFQTTPGETSYGKYKIDFIFKGKAVSNSDFKIAEGFQRKNARLTR